MVFGFCEFLKKADAEGIYLALVKCIKDKNLQVGNIVGMGFDGAATFSGKKTGWWSSKTKETCSTCNICPVTSCSQLACKLPIARLELSMSISLSGSTFTTLLKEQNL